MSTLKTGALRGTSGTADSIQLHASDQSVTFPGNVTCSGTSTGFGGGKILQVVMGTLKDSFLSNSATMTDTGLGATITPASTSNKVLVQVNFGMVCTTTSRAAGFHLYRNGSAVTGAQGTSGTTEDYTMFAYIQNANEVSQHSFSYLDSPSSTSALAYKMYVARVMSDANAISLNRIVTSDAYGCLSTMILMEVEG